MNASYIIIGLVVIVAGAAIALYNGLVRSRTQVAEAWADIDVQLKRRRDLIPNLVETVKGYKGYEEKTLTTITEARARTFQAKTLGERGSAEAALGASISGLLAVAEQYPDLKASANFLELSRELSDTEDKIQAARRFYNGLVRDYNIRLNVFPANLVAGSLGFKAAEFFELGDDPAHEREPIKVSF